MSLKTFRQIPSIFDIWLSSLDIMDDFKLISRTAIFRFGEINYRKVAISNTSCLLAHIGFFRLLMKGIFNPYVL